MSRSAYQFHGWLEYLLDAASLALPLHISKSTGLAWDYTTVQPLHAVTIRCQHAYVSHPWIGS